jgi:hypothetical protein
MTIRAARLDALGIYQGMDVLDDASHLTPQHLPQITACDLPPGRYRWTPAQNPMGGEFRPLRAAEVKPGPDIPDLERVVYRLARLMQASGIPLHADVERWCAWYGGTPDAPKDIA